MAWGLVAQTIGMMLGHATGTNEKKGNGQRPGASAKQHASCQPRATSHYNGNPSSSLHAPSIINASSRAPRAIKSRAVISVPYVSSVHTRANMSSSLYGTGDLPYYMGVIFEKKDPSLRTEWRLSSLPRRTDCIDLIDPVDPQLTPHWRRWPSVPEGTKCDDIDFYDPLGELMRCCSFDNCDLHNIDQDTIWWKDYTCLKNQVVRVDSVRLFLRKHEIHPSWLVIKLLSNSTDLDAVAVDPESCWLLVDVLRGIMRSISENYASETDDHPELLRDLPNVWLLLHCKAFYTMVLPDLVKELPPTIYQFYASRKHWFITKSTVLIVLQRVSRDFLALIRGDGATFYEIVMLNDNWLLGTFKEAMEKCMPVAVLLSLFVPKATVLAACRAFLLQTKIIKSYDFFYMTNAGALRYMTLARMSPARLRATVAASTTDDAGNDHDILGTKVARLLSELDMHISQEGLAARSLLTLLRTHGIARVVRYFQENYTMPPALWTIIHRYFYGTSWRYVCVMNYYTTRRQTEIELL